MTRRGSLAYYLAAWICGCFFMSAAILAKDRLALVGVNVSVSARFLYFYFFALMLGAVPSLLAALLVRRTMMFLGRKQPLLWMGAGALMISALVIVVGGWFTRTMASQHSAAFPADLLFALVGGLGYVFVAGWWLAIPAGAATAYILYRIDRAFSQEPAS